MCESENLFQTTTDDFKHHISKYRNQEVSLSYTPVTIFSMRGINSKVSITQSNICN